jgi:cell division septation protein DedD
MRDFELDDRFWRDALAALQAGERASALAGRYAEYVDLIEDLALDAAGEPALVGFRHAAADANPRLLALVSAAFLARAGKRTLLLDLDPEVRWLEQILGGDFKEGVVDHLQFGTPLAGCARATGVTGLEVMSGGAAFLAGSPLDDPPRFRAALLSLKQGRDAVVVALPPPAESADASGIPALCDAVVTIEDTEGPPGPLGSERAIVRLSGDPRAARELSRLCHRFVGPLPGVAAPARNEPVVAASPGPRHDEPFWAAVETAPRAVGAEPAGQTGEASEESEELDFLSAFEGSPDAAAAATAARTPADPRRAAPRIEDVVEVSRAKSRARRSSGGPPRRRRPLDRRALTLATVVLAALAALALGSRWFAPLFAGWSGSEIDALYDGTPTTDGSAGGPGTVIPLTGPVVGAGADPAADSAAGLGADATSSDPATAAGDPAPWSLQVGSYRSAEAARGIVRDIGRRGRKAFLSPVVLPDRGEWVRVYVGAFGDSASARAALDELVSGGIVAEGSVRATPLAFGLGEYPTAEEAAARIADLAERGIPAYSLGEGPFRVWAGAFQDESESRVLESALVAESPTGLPSLSRRVQ